MRTKMQHTPADRVSKLQRAESLIARGATIGDAAACVGVKYGTLYNWRRRYAGLTQSAMETMRRLELENDRLRRTLLELETGAMRRRLVN